MKKYVLAFAFAALSAQAAPLTAAQKLSDFEQLIGRIESNYGPLLLKPASIRLDLGKAKDEARAEIAATATNAEFYYAMVRFVARFKDGHFKLSLPTTLEASLPFGVDLIGGKVLIDDIDRTKLPESVFPFARGDEVVSFNGKPAMEVVQALAAYVPYGNEKAVLRAAAMSLTRRAGATFPVPQGTATVEIRRGHSASTDTVTIGWTRKGAALDEDWPGGAPTPFAGLFSTFVGDAPSPLEKVQNLSVFDFGTELFGSSAERSYRCSGGTRVSLPTGAEIIQTDPFVAYTYPTAKGRVGYLRIPHYLPVNPVTGQAAYEEYLSRYAFVLRRLEKETVGLVIDQDHNCGGSVSYLESMVSLFALQPFKGLEFQFVASKENLLDFKSWLASAPKNTLEYEQASEVYPLVEDAWKKGEFLAAKTTFHGSEPIFPSAHTRYTKPVIVLIDELAGSGGDAFPAIMQGIGRAKLFGSQTGGLGGHVEEQPSLSFSALKYRMTRSLFFHPNGAPIENNGAKPDFPYEITRTDFMYGYRNYRDAYTAALLTLIP
jgi:hypothetical protein